MRMHQSVHETVNNCSAISATGLLLTVVSIFFSGCGENKAPAAKSKPTVRPTHRAGTQPPHDKQPVDATTPGANNPTVADATASSDAEAADAETTANASSTDAEGTPSLEPSVADGGDEVDSDAEHPSHKKLPPVYSDQSLVRAGSSQSPLEAFRVPRVDNTPPMVNVPAKVRRYAKKLVARYDLDANGTLEPVEWLQMRGDPRNDDLNGDGILTAEELAIRIAVYGHRRLIRLMPGRRLNGPAARAEPSSENAKPLDGMATVEEDAANREKRLRSRQFHVRRSRLPAGLPEWFIEGDANGDAQMSLAEFSAKWSSSELHRFDSYDHDGDGMITARECARGELTRQRIENAEPTTGSTSNEPVAKP